MSIRIKVNRPKGRLVTHTREDGAKVQTRVRTAPGRTHAGFIDHSLPREFVETHPVERWQEQRRIKARVELLRGKR